MADIEAVPGIHIEVKRRAAIAAEAFLVQAESDALPDESPVVLMRGDGSKRWLLMMDLRDVRKAAERFLRAVQYAESGGN